MAPQDFDQQSLPTEAPSSAASPPSKRLKILQRSSRFKNPAIAVDIPAELQFSPSSPEPQALPLPSVRPTDELSGGSGFQQRSGVTVEGSSFLRIFRNCNTASEVRELNASRSFSPEKHGSSSRVRDRETAFPDTPWEWEEAALEAFPDAPWEWEEAALEAFPAASKADTLPVLPPCESGSDSKRSKRCKSCRKRLCLGATFKCRCGDVFCSSHRFPDQHACTFDVKALDRQMIAKANPVIKADKLKNRI